MARLLAALIAATCASVALAALPPGYDEELWCPAGSCLRMKEMPPGWTGPSAAFHECFAEGSGETRQPQEWGVKVASQVRAALVAGRHTMDRCGEPPSPPPPMRRAAKSQRRRWQRGDGSRPAPQPRPNGLSFSGAHRILAKEFAIILSGESDLIRGASERFLERLGNLVQTSAGDAATELTATALDTEGLTMWLARATEPSEPGLPLATLKISCDEPTDPAVLSLDQPEGYSLEVAASGEVSFLLKNGFISY